MHLGLVLEMTSAGLAERVAVVDGPDALTHGELARAAWGASARLAATGATSLVYLGGNDLAAPVALFGAAGAGIPFVPLNYRLSADQLRARLAEHPGALVVADPAVVPGGPDAGWAPDGTVWVDRRAFLADLPSDAAPPPPVDPELPCVLLYTSGTTAAPKAAVLRHRHLMAYLLGTVEFAGAGEEEATLVSVPPYHIAGLANLLSNTYAGRAVHYLDPFVPDAWLDTVRGRAVTHAMVVPTMLARVVARLEGAVDAGCPSLRTLSYGGAPMPAAVLQRAMELFPTTGFVNAYGLTETSSTIALLDPEDHRVAAASEDPEVRARLASVGRVLPGIELDVRDEDGRPVPAGTTGLLFVRGEQISGEYDGQRLTDDDGWFATRDRGRVDAGGYLFIEGRADDTIIRGGENIAPAEIEEVLLSLPGVADAVVVGLPDDEWGQRLAAVVVPAAGDTPDADELREAVRRRLRSSKTPDVVEFWAELPRTETGKLLRRVVTAELAPPG